jgi:uncharacterized membrane protein
MEYIMVVILLSGLSVLSYWRGNPIIFMLTAGTAIMAGLYTPDAMSSLGYNTIGVGVGLMLIMYSLVCIALAYANLFKRSDG